MKKRGVKKNPLKDLHGKKGMRAAEKIEKKVKSPLLCQAQALANNIREIEQELMALPCRVSQQWLWLGDIKRAGYMMEQVIEMLEGPTNAAEGVDAAEGEASEFRLEEVPVAQ